MKARLSLLLGLLQAFLLRNHPAYLVLFVTHRCNCRCPMCFNRANVLAADAAAELPLEAYRRIAASLRPLPQLLLSGGEPFLRPDLPSIVEAFYRLARTRQVSIPTNGTLTERIPAAMERLLSTCPEAIFNLNLSLDHLGPAHDRSRALDGCFERLTATLEALALVRARSDRLTVNVLTVVTAANAARIPEITAYVHEHFQPNYHFLEMVRGTPGPSLSHFDLAEAEAQVASFYASGRAFRNLPLFNRLAPAVFTLMRATLARARRSRRRAFPCLAGRKMIVISPEGRLHPCEPLWLEPESAVRFAGRPPAHGFEMARLTDFRCDARAALQSHQARRIAQWIPAGQCACAYPCAVLNSIIYSPRTFTQILPHLLHPILLDFPHPLP